MNEPSNNSDSTVIEQTCTKFKLVFGYENWLQAKQIICDGHYDENKMHADYYINNQTIYTEEMEIIRAHCADDPFFRQCLYALLRLKGKFRSGAGAENKAFRDPNYGNLQSDPDFDRLYS